MHLVKGSRFKMFVFSLVTIVDATVTVLSLGFVAVDWRGKFLFSDWMTDRK